MRNLDDLLYELGRVQGLSESEVMKEYNSDSKAEIIRDIEEDIIVAQEYEEEQSLNYDIEEDYEAICRVQGLSRYC